MPPLFVHLIFHPASQQARDTALMLHRALNADAALPGLAVPTVLLVEDGTNWPPIEHDLDQAESSIAVVPADDEMVVEDEVPSGRISWEWPALPSNARQAVIAFCRCNSAKAPGPFMKI